VLILLTLCGASTAYSQDAGNDREQVILKRYVELLERQPKLGTAFDRVYRHHVERGSVDVFLAPYREKETGEAALLVGLVEAQRGRETDAAAAFLKAEKLRPNDPLPSFSLARVLVAEHDFAGAIAACERALSKQPARAELLEVSQLLAQVQTRNGQREAAIKTWQRVETQFGTDARTQERVARGLLEAGDAAGARQRFEKLAQQASDPTARVQFAIKAAELQLEAKERDGAIAALDRLLDGLKPDSWPARLVSQRIEDAFLRDDDLKGLEAYYRTRLKRLPNDFDSQLRFARLLARQQRVEDSIAALRDLLKRAPSQRAARQALIDLLANAQRWSEAASEHAELDRLAPGDADNLRAWGQIVLRDEARPLAERRKDAEVVWRKLLDAKPKEATAQVQVAEWLRSIERTDEAVALYRRAIELAPNETQYREALGEFLFALDRKADAIATWHEIASGSRKSVESLSRVGQLLKNHDDVEGALAAYAAACDIEPRVTDLLAHARLLRDTRKFDESLKQIEKATALAESSEERQQVEAEELATLQAADRIGPELQRLRERMQKGEASLTELLRLARLSWLIERIDEALIAARTAVKRDDLSVAARTLLATIAQQAKQWPEAAEQRQWLAEHDRRAESVHLTALVEIERERQDYAAALKASERLVAIAPDHPEHRRVQSLLLFELKRPNDGLAAMREAARQSGDVSSWNELASKLAHLERKDEAIETYWHAFSLAKTEDEQFRVVRALGRITVKTLRFVQVVQRLERMQFEGQQNFLMRRCLVELHRSVGDNAAAIVHLKSLNADEPNNVRTLRELVWLLEATSDRKQACEYQSQIVLLEPSTENERQLASLLLSAGDTSGHETSLRRLAARSMNPVERLRFVDEMAKLNQLKLATELLEADLKRQPNDWELQFRLAVISYRLGHHQRAATQFAQVRQLNVPKTAFASRLSQAVTTSGQTPAAPPTVREQLAERVARGRAAIQQLRNVSIALANKTSPIPMSVVPDFDAACVAALFGQFEWGPDLEVSRKALAEMEAVIDAPMTRADPRFWDWVVMLRMRYPVDPAEAKHEVDRISYRRIVQRLAREDGPEGKLILLSWLAAEGIHRSEIDLESERPPEKEFGFNARTGVFVGGGSSVIVVDNDPDRPQFNIYLPAVDRDALDALVAALDSLNATHPHLLRADIEVSQLLCDLCEAGRDADAERVAKIGLALGRKNSDMAQLIAAARPHRKVVNLLLEGLRARWLGETKGMTQPVRRESPKDLRVLFDSVTGLSFQDEDDNRFLQSQSWRVVEWYLRNQARAEAAAVSYPVWLTLPAVAEVDRPLPQRAPPNPFIGPRPGIGGGAGLPPRTLYDNPFGIRSAAHLDEASLLAIWRQLLAYEKTTFDVGIEAINAAAERGTPRERLFLRLMHSVLLSWNGQREKSETILSELLRESPQDFALRVELVASRAMTEDFAGALKLLDAEVPPSGGADASKEESRLKSELQHRERYALQLAVRLNDKARAMKAVTNLAKSELPSDVWYEVARLCLEVDRDGVGKAFLAQSTPPDADVGNQMFELSAAYLIANEPDKAIAAALGVLKKLPESKPLLVPLFRYQPKYWERQKELAQLLQSDVPQKQKLHSLLETILYHNRWTEQTRYSRELQLLHAKYETEPPQMLLDAAKQKLAESKHDDAVELFERACAVRNELLEEHLADIELAFMHSQRPLGFLKLLMNSDLRTLPKSSRRAVELARSRVVNGQGTLDALRLLRAGSAALPSYQQAALRHWDDKDASQHWPFFLVRHEDLFPVTETTAKRQWLGLDERTNDGTSRHVLAFEDIIPALAESKIRGALAEETARQRQRVPQWLAGEFYLAFFELHDNQFDAARARLLKLAAAPVPSNVVGQMARLVARVQNAEAVAIAFISRLCDREPESVQRLNEQPAWHLAWMHSKRGERQQIEAVLARAVAQQETLIDSKLPQDERLQRHYQLWISHIEVLQEFACSGESLRQLKRIHQHATSISSSERPKVWDLAHPQIFNLERVRSALASASFEESSQFLADFVTLADDKLPESQSRAELLLDVTSPGLASSPLTSFFELCLEAASKLEDRERLNLLRERLATASKQRPDITVEIARTRFEMLTAETSEARIKELQRLAVRLREFSLPETVSTMAEQQVLTDRIGLWLVARAIRVNGHAELEALRSTFESECLEAAKRHPRDAWRETVQAEQRRGL